MKRLLTNSQGKALVVNGAALKTDWYYGYVSDGLVLMLDGIDKGGSNGNWTDLVSGHVFENHGATALTDHFYFDGSGYLTNDSYTAGVPRTYSLEIIFEKANNDCLLFAPAKVGSSGWCCGFNSTGLFVPASGSSSSRFEVPEGVLSLVRTPDDAYGNASPLTKNSSTYFALNSATNYIGRRAGTTDYRPYQGRIYAIRIYNRTLTLEEVAHNWLVDRRRFGLKPVQVIQNGNFADGTAYWVPYNNSNGTLSAANGELTYTVVSKKTNSYANKIRNTEAVAFEGHTYYIVADIYVPVACNVSFVYYSGSRDAMSAEVGWNHYVAYYTFPADNTSNWYMGVNSMANFSVGDEVIFKNIYAIDLTATFGAGAEPTEEQCSQIFTEDYYPYNPNL